MRALGAVGGVALCLSLGLSAGAAGAEDRSLTWFPVVFYTPETSLGLGAGAVWTSRRANADRPDTVNAFALGSAKSQFILFLSPEVQRGPWRLGLPAGYRYFPDDYYGIGPDSAESDRESYTTREASIAPSAALRIWSRLYLGAVYDRRETDILDLEPGGLLDQGRPTGVEGGAVGGAGPLVEWDSRDDLFLPTRGSRHRATAVRYTPGLGGDFDFEAFRLDSRAYAGFAAGRVLALQAQMETVAGEAPFFVLPRIDDVRGILSNRYRDRRSAAAQAELRFPLRGRWSAAAFTGAGAVWGGAPLTFRNVRGAGGGGIRYRLNPREGINLRLDLGFDGAHVRPYLRLLEAF